MKSVRVHAVALAIVLLLAAAAPAGPKATLEFWTISLQPFFTDYVNGLVAAYQRANPGVQVKWVDVQMQAIEQKLLAAIAGGVGFAVTLPGDQPGHVGLFSESASRVVVSVAPERAAELLQERRENPPAPRRSRARPRKAKR